MRKKLNKTDEEFQMFADYYKLYQDFYVPEEGDTYWQSLISEADAFLKKYKTINKMKECSIEELMSILPKNVAVSFYQLLKEME